MPKQVSILLALAWLSTLAISYDGDCSKLSPICSEFKNPPNLIRPAWRYWLPDASVDPNVVAEDIELAAAVGAGGTEFLAFYEYGGSLSPMPPGADWSKYGFGTPAYRDILKAALKAHEKHGLHIDLPFGPNQGQGVPADPKNEGLQWNMLPHTVEIPQNGKFDNIIPGWGDGELISLVTAFVPFNTTFIVQAANIMPGLPPIVNLTISDYTLAEKTLKQHQGEVDQETGRLQIDLPAAEEGKHYRLFAFYQKLAGYKNLEFESKSNGSIFDLGSYAVDHLDAQGAKVLTDFWEKYLLSDQEIANLIPKVGRYVWEDSMEAHFNVTWSNTLLNRFKKLHGYGLELYLPLITFKQNNLLVQGAEPGSFRCALDSDDQGTSHVHNYRASLSAGYNEYLETLKKWAHDVLKIGLSAQTAYGTPMDMMNSIGHVDAPECESLSFGDSIDNYRQFAGPAQLAGRMVISNEMGAVKNFAYRYHVKELLFSIHRALMGYVNRVVLHGQAYSGEYYETTWPGHTPFTYLFSDPWSKRMPIWNNGLKSIIDYISRIHYTQQWTAKVDVVIYDKVSASNTTLAYQYPDLQNKGYSYSYLSADNLNSEQAIVKDGILAPDGPAWKAILVGANKNLTLGAISALKKFANDGLPVVLSGGLPGYYPLENSTSAEFKTQLSELTKLKNVHSVGEDKVAEKLESLGITPRVALKTSGSVYSTWREGDDDISYALLYADLEDASGTATFSTKAPPFTFDCWTGNVQPVVSADRKEESVSIPFSLKANQTLVIAFSNSLSSKIATPQTYITDLHASILDVRSSENRTSILVPASTETRSVELSNGTKVSLDDSKIPASFKLSNWTLTAEHWESPKNVNDSTHTIKTNTTHQLSSLASWAAIQELEDASGVGYYETTFEWSPTSSKDSLGAYLTISKIVDTAIVLINDKQVPQVDLFDAKLDITPYLRSGTNQINITVPTTLWNYIRTILSELKTANTSPLIDTTALFGRTDSGLVGEVVIIPYKEIEL